MATKTKNEVLASNSGEGAYGMSWESRVVRRGEKTYIVNDEFCGMDSLEGGQYRPFVYAVPADRVAEIVNLYERADENWNEYNSNWTAFLEVVLPSLQCLGRKSNLYRFRNL